MISQWVQLFKKLNWVKNVCEVSTQVANNFAKVLCSESIFAFMETFMQPPGNTFDMNWC